MKNNHRNGPGPTFVGCTLAPGRKAGGHRGTGTVGPGRQLDFDSLSSWDWNDWITVPYNDHGFGKVSVTVR